MHEPSFTVEELTEFASVALQAAGVPMEGAAVTADSLVDADRRGIYSHGLLRLPLYVAALRAGGINPQPSLQWIREQGATAVLDADSGLGQVAMLAATDRALRTAGSLGTAIVAVQNSVHYGSGAYWTDRLARHGMIGILVSTTGPTVAPFGGTQKVLGTNPITITVPSAGDHTLSADMATSNGAYGKIVAARNENQPIPADWAVGPDGRPTQDAAAALDGALLPFGGPKGSAIAVMIEALAAGLTDASFSHQSVDIWADRASRMNTGHLLIALDTEAFTGRRHTEDRVAELQDLIRASGATNSTVYAPGDIEHARAAQETGVTLAESTLDQLNELATDLSLPTLPRTDRHS